MSLLAERALSLHEQAISLYRSGRLAEALPLYKQLAKQDPQNPIYLKDWMWISWKTGDAATTASIAAQLTHMDPTDVEAWNLRAQANTAIHQPAEAVRAYRRQLKLEPHRDDIRLSIARLLMDLKDWDGAYTLLQGLAKKPNPSLDVLRGLARAQALKGLYADAVQTWNQVLAVAPDSLDDQYEKAKALYFAGSPEEAVAQLQAIRDKDPQHGPATDFLTDDALAHGDLRRAEELLTSRLTEFRKQDELRILQLVDVQQSRGEWDRSVTVLKRFLNVNPDNGQALLRLGDAQAILKQDVDSQHTYEKVLAKNPGSLRAYSGLAEAYIAQNNPRQALAIIAKARKLDPTNPTLLFSEARYLNDAREFTASQKLLTDWLAQQKDTTPLPVLLYHGLTPHMRDTMLAYAVHMTTRTFQDHMETLKRAGYTPVTVEEVNIWRSGKGKLPAKPVLITFDDARVDSFLYGDQILKETGLKATMFAHTLNVDENLPGHASWNDLQRHQEGGRWEIQSHGDRAHNAIPVDADGRQGIFLANKIWLTREERLETDEEWRTRIREDHQSGIRKMKSHLNRAPIALSWPEGNYGQDSVPNDPQASAINLAIAPDYFSLCFQQDEFGINLQSRDKCQFSRIQPQDRWSGQDLLDRIQQGNPVTRAYRQLMQQALWEDRRDEARHWMKALEAAGISRADMDLWQSRIERGSPLRAWTPGIEYHEDNQTRDRLQLDQRLGLVRTPRWLLEATHHLIRYRESGTPDVVNHGGGLALLWTSPLRHTLSLESEAHIFTEGLADDTYSARGAWNAQWNDRWGTYMAVGRSPYDTARALNAAISQNEAHGGISTQKPEQWKATLSASGYDLSDDNTRYTGALELSHRLVFKTLQLVGRSSYDHMERIRVNYYSPDDLQIHQGGLEWNQPWGATGAFQVRYLAGSGKERVTSWEFVQEVSSRLTIPVYKGWIEPGYTFYSTPVYREHNYRLRASVPF